VRYEIDQKYLDPGFAAESLSDTATLEQLQRTLNNENVNRKCSYPFSFWVNWSSVLARSNKRASRSMYL
jgi:hypothetical protein